MTPLNDDVQSWIVGQDSTEQLCQYLQQQAAAGVSFFCFDYFDTLIVRDIEPEYTKQLAAKLHSQFLLQLISPEELYGIRQQLEKKLCDQRAAAGGELEFYLDSFAVEYRLLLLERLGNIFPLQDTDHFVQTILAIETRVEQLVQRPCPDTIQVLAWLREQGLSTVLISDFYLPGTWFEKMLESIGIQNQFDHIYISADHALAKGSGRLYQKVCQQLACRPEHLLMIGDNPHSDIMRAREKGLHCIQLLNPEQQAFYQQWQPEQLTAVDRVEQRFSKSLAAEGLFKEISTSLWYFTFQLLQELEKNQVEDVFFFSKEGEFLKKLFDRLQEDLFGSRVINSHYILVSRKATFLASLRPLADEDFNRLFAHYRDISLRDFLLSLNIEESVAVSLCQQAGLDFQTRHTDLQHRPEFQQLLDSNRFQQLYEQRRQSQQENFIAYLNSFGVDYRQKGLTVVDVGWKGTIQDNVYHILQERIPMQGYFAGSLIATERRATNRKQGLLFDDTCPHLAYFNVYNNNRSLFEMMLGASHGSADGYFTADQYGQLPGDHQRQVKERIKTGQGELWIATVDLPEERALFEEKIRPIQEQVYADAVGLNRAYICSGCTLPAPEWFARRHARMVFKPTTAEVDFFESLYHLENFGIFEFTDFRTEADLSLGQRWQNFRNMRKNPAILEMGTWPPIILRRLGLDWYRHLNGYRRYRREFP
jgi:FMN phosphatase YigB (HAD superfamily)